MAMLLNQKKDLRDFIPWAWSCYNWMIQHSTLLHVVRIDKLHIDMTNPCFLSYTRVPHGRPRTQRLRAGKVQGPQGLAFQDSNAEMSEQFQDELAANKRRPHCSTCGRWGIMLQVVRDLITR